MAEKQQEAPSAQERIEKYVKENMQGELKQEMARADSLANLVMDFNHDSKGQLLANVHTSQGFQSVWDYRGAEKKRWRLDRKKEQVAHNYDVRTQLFQKIYYAKDLLLDDERELRSAFVVAEKSYEMQRAVGQAALFLGFFPLTYRLARTVRPATLLIWTGAYYYFGYKRGFEPLTDWQFQSSLNSAARPFALKYEAREF